MKHANYRLVIVAVMAGLVMTGCVSMKLNVEDYTEPLKEYTLEGKGSAKVLVIPIRGVLSDTEQKGMPRRQPSLIKEVVSQIKKAEKDPSIVAIVLKVNSPGGTITASDILYNEFNKLKIKRNIPLVACLMDVATSGGYYVSLPADHIIAHPTTITGSVGVVFIRPKFSELLDKIGVSVETSKSGKNKDMGSPFRTTTEDELKLLQSIIDEMAILFESKVLKHRKVKDEVLKEIMTAKLYTAKQALELGMIDQIGYTDEAIAKAKELAGIESDSRVVIYRRVENADDNIYNNISARSGSGTPLIDLGPLSTLSKFKAGFYYTWPAATE